jgi:hypothetical protein
VFVEKSAVAEGDGSLEREPSSGDGRDRQTIKQVLSLRLPLAGNSRQQLADFGLAVATVTAESSNRAEFAGLRPPRDGLGVDAEHRGDLGGSQ